MVSRSPSAGGTADRDRAAADAAGSAATFFAADLAATGIVFDLRFFGGIALGLAPFAAFAAADGPPVLVGFFWSDGAASAALAAGSAK